MTHSANGCLYNGLYVLFLPTTLMPGRSAASKKSEFSILLPSVGPTLQQQYRLLPDDHVEPSGLPHCRWEPAASAFQHISKRCIPPGCVTAENGGWSPFVSETNQLRVHLCSLFIAKLIFYWFLVLLPRVFPPPWDEALALAPG